MLWRRCSNVLTTSKSDVVTMSETDAGTTLIFDRATTLWQRQRRCASWDKTLLIHPTLAKLAEDRITANTISRNFIFQIPFSANIFSFLTTDHYFCLLDIHSQLFWLGSPLQDYSSPLNFQNRIKPIQNH